MRFNLTKRRYWRLAKQVMAQTAQFRTLSDTQLQAKTEAFRQQLAAGADLRSLIVDAYAVVCEADRRILGMTPYLVQVFGAIAIEYNNIIEMKTGEGKTLTATMPMYLHGLSGPGNFLITANEYLADRDATEMGAVYRWLGLTVEAGVTAVGHAEAERDKATIYGADIVYTTNSALGFDYLFDNLASGLDEQYLRGFRFALLDEADAVLLDTASTPLIISGVPKVQSNLYGIADSFIQIINEDDDYELSENFKNVWFTPEGIAHINAYFGLDDVLSEDNRELYRHLVIALKAHKLFKRDREYVVDDGEVVLVDRANGRELTGMKLESGMHQALEAKEGVHVTPEMRTMASVTYQNLFRMFSQLAGMTGTAATDRSEFMETYRLAVVKVPTNRPNIRKDLPDQLFISNAAKLTASLQVVREAYTHERPLLIETGSLALSNLYSRLLLQERIPHNLLNARAAAKEARIIAEAGQTGAVTVATSMAGRGTDIHLSDQAKKAGGLLVLGTERMSSARVDNQLRGRAGRQGEPGASQFFVSLEDRVVIENAPRRVRLYTEKHANQPQQALNRRGRFGRVIDHAQGADSASQRSARFSTLQYGEVFRVQRDKVYATRDAVMAASDLSGVIAQVIAQAQQDFFATPQDAASTLAYIYENVDRDYRPDDLQQHPELGADPAFLARVMQARMAQQRQFLPANDQWQYFLRLVILKAIDAAWIEQVDHLQSLRSVTMNRSTAQHDPVFEYQKEARAAFARMRADMNARIARFLMCSELERTPDGQVDVSFP